jgi:hypothetical protein
MNSRRLPLLGLRLRRVDRGSLPELPADCEALHQKMICEFARRTGDADVMPGVPLQVLPRVVGRVAPAAADVVVRHGGERVIGFLTCRVWIAFQAVARQRGVPPQVVVSEYAGGLFHQMDELRDIVAMHLRPRHHPRIQDASQLRDLLFSLLALRIAAETELAGTTPAAARGASAASAGCPDPLGEIRAALEHEPRAGYPSGSTDGGVGDG